MNADDFPLNPPPYNFSTNQIQAAYAAACDSHLKRIKPMNNISSPANHDDATEQLIQAKGKTAARITLADVAANIAGEYYFLASDGVRESDPYENIVPSLYLLTFCVLVLKNGFTVTGSSACASPENFDAEIGRRVARENAVQKIWPLMGYALKEKLNHSPTPAALPHPLKDFYG